MRSLFQRLPLRVRTAFLLLFWITGSSSVTDLFGSPDKMSVLQFEERISDLPQYGFRLARSIFSEKIM